MAVRLGVSRQYVSKCIKELITRGYIERQSTPPGTSPRFRYRIIMNEDCEIEEDGGDESIDITDGIGSVQGIILGAENEGQKPLGERSKSTGEITSSCGKSIDVNRGDNSMSTEEITCPVEKYPPIVDKCADVNRGDNSMSTSGVNINVPRNVPNKVEAEFVDRHSQVDGSGWERAATAFKKRYGLDVWKSWWGQCELIDSDPYTVQVPTKFVADHLRTHYTEFIETTLGLDSKIKLVVAAKVGGEKVD